MNARKPRLGSPHIKTSKTITQVERMAAFGLDESEIAYCLETDPLTVKMQYGLEIKHGTAKMIAEVGAAQYHAALRGDSSAAQFLLRSRARWVTPTKVDVDAKVTVDDKRQLMDKIVTLVAKSAAPQAALENLAAAEATGKPN